MARTAARWTAVVALVAGLGACGGDDEPTIATTTSTTEATTTESTTTTTEPELTDEEAITQLVEEWWQVSREIAAGERDVEEAAEFAAGDYLDGYREGANEFFADGLVSDLSDRSSIEVESVVVSGDDAESTVCIVNGDQTIVAATGEVADDVVNATRYTDELARTEGGWRIVVRGRVAEYEGAEQCAEP